MSIYIREAHPVDGWWFGKAPFKWIFKLIKSKAALDVYDPKTIEERRAVASDCEKSLEYYQILSECSFLIEELE